MLRSGSFSREAKSSTRGAITATARRPTFHLAVDEARGAVHPAWLVNDQLCHVERETPIILSHSFGGGRFEKIVASLAPKE